MPPGKTSASRWRTESLQTPLRFARGLDKREGGPAHARRGDRHRDHRTTAWPKSVDEGTFAGATVQEEQIAAFLTNTADEVELVPHTWRHLRELGEPTDLEREAGVTRDEVAGRRDHPVVQSQFGKERTTGDPEARYHLTKEGFNRRVRA